MTKYLVFTKFGVNVKEVLAINTKYLVMAIAGGISKSYPLEEKHGT